MFLIVSTEIFFIYLGKRRRMSLKWGLEPKCVNKLILLRRVICIVLGKIGLVLVSFMSASTESGKFKYLSSPDATCTQSADLLNELEKIALMLPKIKSSLIVYIMFIIVILVLNFYEFCKKCYKMLKDHPMIQDDDMHMGEYS